MSLVYNLIDLPWQLPLFFIELYPGILLEEDKDKALVPSAPGWEWGKVVSQHFTIIHSVALDIASDLLRKIQEIFKTKSVVYIF